MANAIDIDVFKIVPGMDIVSEYTPQSIEHVTDAYVCDGTCKSCFGDPSYHVTTARYGQVYAIHTFDPMLYKMGRYDGRFARVYR